MARVPNQPDERDVDLTCTDAVRRFVAHTDGLGALGSEAVVAYWNAVRLRLPDWVPARASQLHPLSQEYFDLQDQLYIFLRGTPHAGASSEFAVIDKPAAVASRLAYPGRPPGNLNTYMRAHAKLVDHFDSALACDVLEIGSGWGFSAEYVARLGHRVTGIDINPDFVEVASQRSARQDLDIDYRLGTFEAPPLRADELFDVIYCFEAFHHTRNFRGVLAGLVARLRPHGQFILFGEPFIEPGMWPAWGLRLDPLSIYCIAKFGWWESGWTRGFMGSVFRAVGLRASFIDEHSDFERYMVGRLGCRYESSQLSHQPVIDGWLPDRHHLVATGRCVLEFYRPLRRLLLDIESFAPTNLSVRFESEALAAGVVVVLVPGTNAISLTMAACPPGPCWTLRIHCQTWNPLRDLGAGDDRELSFHLRSIEEVLA